MSLYDYLNKPKSPEELQAIVKEMELKWNEDQTKLWMLLDPALQKDKNGNAFFVTDERRRIVLKAVEQALSQKKLAFINKDIMPHFEHDFIITPAEIIDIAEKSGIYESPNGKIIRFKTEVIK